MSVPSQPAPTLKQNVAQSGAEVRAFVASLKGKTPAEAMGVVASSRLVRGMILSLVIQLVAVLALTVPYALFAGDAPVGGTQAAMPAQPQGSAPAPASQPEAAPPATGPAAGQPDQPTSTPPVGPAAGGDAGAPGGETKPKTTPDAKPVKPPTGDVEDLIDAESLGS